MASSASPTPLRPMDGGLSGAPSAQPASPARAAVDVIALTSRDDFLLEVGATLGGQASVNPVDSVSQALEMLANARRPQVLMIDSRDLEDIPDLIANIRAQATHPSIVVFAADEALTSLSTLLEQASVFAILPLPIDEARTSSTYAGAALAAKAKYGALPTPQPQNFTAEFASAQSATGAPVFTSTENAATDGAGGGRNFTPQIVLGSLAALIIGGGLIAYVLKGKAPAPTLTEETTADAAAAAQIALPAVETSLIKGKVDELLEKARLAMRERRYAEPSGDNALLYYRSAVAADASSAEALDGLTRISGVLAGRFDDALTASDLDEAATALAQFKTAIPEDPRIAVDQQRLTSAQISKSIAEANLDRAAAIVRAAQQNNLLPAAQVVRWRTEITRLQGEAKEKHQAELAAREAATAAEQKKAREAKVAAAETERQAQLQRDKDRDEQQKAAQAVQATEQAQAAADSVASASAGALQGSLKRKRYVAPEYPIDALARKIPGLVHMAFTVNARGEPRDVEVVSAEPKGTFDRAAIAAVKRWRYEPLVVNGVAQEVPVRMQIRFTPNE